MLQLECDIKHNICKLYLFVYKDISPQWLQLRKQLEYITFHVTAMDYMLENCTFTPVNMPVVETLKSK